MKKNEAVAPAIETSPIRLSVDETRLIMRCATAGKPIPGDYHANAMAELGILNRIEISEEKDTAQKIAAIWKRARRALSAKDGEGLHQSMHDLERLTSDRDRNNTKYLFTLSDLGKQIARGINVRLNGQYIRNNRSGQAAIESALILPIFFFVIVGIFDFGQFLYFNQSLTMRLEAGARYAAVHGCKSPIASVCDPAVNVAVTNTADGSGAPILAHLSASDISASVSFHRSQDPTPQTPKPAWIANEEDRVTLSVSDYPIDLLLLPKFHRKASASQPIEWYQCYRDCK